MATKDEKLRYVIEALWRGGSATDQARKGIKEVGKAAKETDTEVKKAGQGLAGFGKQMLALTGVSLSVAGGIAVIQKGFETLKEGADNLVVEDKFERLAATVGATADSMLADLQYATRGTVSNMELMASATDILSLGLAKNRDDTVRLATVIGELGLDMQQVTLTLANNSKARLDSLGLSVEGVTKRTNELVAAGKDANEAFDLAVLEGLEQRVELLGSSAETTAGQIQILETAWRNFVDEVKAGIAADLAPDIEVYSGAYADQVRRTVEANLAAADSLRDVQTEAQRVQKELDALGGGFLAWGGDLKNDIRRAALQDALVTIVDEMARGTGSAKEFRAALIDAFGSDAVQRIDNMGTEIIALAGGMGNVEQRWRDAQPTLAQFTRGLEDLARAGREAAQNDPFSRYEKSIQRLREASTGRDGGLLGGGAEDLERLDALRQKQQLLLSLQEKFTAAAERTAEARAAADAQLNKTLESQIPAIQALIEAQGKLAGSQGEYVGALRDNSKEIEKIWDALGNDLTDLEREQFEERLGLIDEFSREANNRWTALQNDLSTNERRALIARLRELEETHGELVTIYTGDAVAAKEAAEEIVRSQEEIATAQWNMVSEIVAADMGGVFTDSALNVQVALGLITEAEAAVIKATRDMNTELQGGAKALSDYFGKDGFISQQESDLMKQALDNVRDGVLDLNQVLGAIETDSLQQLLGLIERGADPNSAKWNFLPDEDIQDFLDIDTTGIDTAKEVTGDIVRNLDEITEEQIIPVEYQEVTDSSLAVEDLLGGLQEVSEGVWKVPLDGLAVETAVANMETLFSYDGREVNVSVKVSETGGKLPGKAAGGPVLPGQPYVVGEKGIEVFIPSTAGTVVPNHALASGGSPLAGGTVSVNLFVNMTPQGGMTPGQFATQVAGIMNDQLAKMMAT